MGKLNREQRIEMTCRWSSKPSRWDFLLLFTSFTILHNFQSFSNRFGKKRPAFLRDEGSGLAEKKRNVKMNINFAEEAVKSRLDVAAPRLGVPSVYETKPWTFLPQSGKEEGISFTSAIFFTQKKNL